MAEPSDFASVRDLVLHFAARQGWQTQRQLAVLCGLDETALSRFLNGEQDIGASRTHALFQQVGIPVALYDQAYALLGRAQASAAAGRGHRTRAAGVGGLGAARSPRLPARREPRLSAHGWYGSPPDGALVAGGELQGERPLAGADLPAAVVIAHFQANGFSGDQIAKFFLASPGVA